jgi:hypothetical protein
LGAGLIDCLSAKVI